MEFEYSKKTKMYMEQVTDFVGKHVYPAEAVFARTAQPGADALAGAAHHGRAEGQGARARACGTSSCPRASGGRG